MGVLSFLNRIHLLLATCCAANRARERTFNIENDRDVLVFLHIQKTGGTTFNRHLIKDIDGYACPQHPEETRKYHRSICNHRDSNNTWLFSRYNVGWPCGVHADWTALHECVNKKIRALEGRNKRRYFYITYLRDPLQRFVSEWQHVARGATWKRQKLRCNGQENTVPECYTTPDWNGVTLDNFLNCPSNLAFNRQTRMLSDLHAVNCYENISLDFAMRNETIAEMLLKSANENLRKMAFFGMLEFQRESQLLFEKTYNLNFVNDFLQTRTRASLLIPELDPAEIDMIKKSNELDFKLYKEAKLIFFERLDSHQIPRPE